MKSEDWGIQRGEDGGRNRGFTKHDHCFQEFKEISWIRIAYVPSRGKWKYYGGTSHMMQKEEHLKHWSFPL